MFKVQSLDSVGSAPVATQVENSWVVLKQTLLVSALIVLPLFHTLVPPLEDYPNHLARMFALATLPGDEFLARFYETEWAPIPNLIMDLSVPPLVPWFGVYTAGRIFIGLTLLLMLLGPMLLHRTLYGRWSAWPLVGGLFVYNGFLFVGLMNYLFGVGVAVIGLAVWIMLSARASDPKVDSTFGIDPMLISLNQRIVLAENRGHFSLTWPFGSPMRPSGSARCARSAILRAIVSLAFCAVLYVCHLSALGLYGLGIASFEAWRLWTRKPWSPASLLVSAAAFGVPFLPFLYLLMRSPTWGLSSAIDWESQGKLDAVTQFLSVYSDLTDIPFLVVIAAAIGIAVKRRLVRFHPAGLIVAAVLSAAFFAMPRMAFGSWMADQRLVVGIFFMTLGFISVDLRKLENQNAFFAICLVAIAFRVVDISVNWAAISQPLLELRNSVRTMPPGSRLLVTQADELANGSLDAALAHAPNLAIIERSALVSRLFVVPGKQVLHARTDYRDHVDTEDGDTPNISRLVVAARSEEGASGDGSHYWDRWPDFYDYLIVLGTDPDESANPATDLLQMVHNGHGFQLYKIRKPVP